MNFYFLSIFSSPRQLHKYSTMKIFTIYRITNNITKKEYIGYTENFEQRMNDHAKKKRDTYISNSIQKYGWHNFTVDILYQSLDMDHCKNVMEAYFINEHDSINLGYNLKPGGEGFDSETNSKFGKLRWQDPEYRNKMTDARKNNWQDPEYRELQQKINTERWESEEYRQKVKDGIAQFWTDEERLNQSNKLKEILSDPKERERLADRARKNWDIPGYRENQQKKQSDSWNDPNSKLYALKKDYIVTSPTGEVFNVKGLKSFCRDNKLNSKIMYKISNGLIDEYKGWRVVKI